MEMRPAKINGVMKAVQSVKNGMKWDERTYKVRKRLKTKKEKKKGEMGECKPDKGLLGAHICLA